MKIIKFFLIAFIILSATACTTTFKEDNELAIPPFFKEEYKKLRENSK